MHLQPRVAKSSKIIFSPHNQTNNPTNKQERGHLNSTPCFLAFSFSFPSLPPIFSFLSSSQAPLPLPPMSPFGTIVVSFESKRMIKILNQRKRNHLCIIAFYGCSKLSFNTPDPKETRSPLQSKNKTKREQHFINSPMALTFLSIVRTITIYCSNLNTLTNYSDLYSLHDTLPQFQGFKERKWIITLSNVSIIIIIIIIIIIQLKLTFHLSN